MSVDLAVPLASGCKLTRFQRKPRPKEIDLQSQGKQMYAVPPPSYITRIIDLCLQCRRCGFDPWVGSGYPLRYSCLEDSMDRGAWGAVVHGGHKESDMT